MNPSDANNPTKEHCRKAIAYVKMKIAPDDGDPGKGLRLAQDDNPVLKDMGNDILATYVVDMENHFQFIRQRDLDAAGLTLDELHRQAIYNLSGVAREKVRVQPYGNIYAVLMGGNFESSLILFDSFWNDSCAHLAPNGYVVAFPARDILAFTDAKNEAGIRELGELIARSSNASVTHKLTSSLFAYAQGKWTPYQANQAPVTGAGNARTRLLAKSGHWSMHVPADWTQHEDKLFHMTSADKCYGFRIAELTWQQDDARSTEELIQMVYDTDLKSMFGMGGRNFQIVSHSKSCVDGLHHWVTELLDRDKFDRLLFKHLAKGRVVIRGSFNDFHHRDLNESNAALGWIRDSLTFVDEPDDD